MLRALRNSWRLMRVALSFARHDALFPLEILGIAPALVGWARLFRSRRYRKIRAALQGSEWSTTSAFRGKPRLHTR